jgi:uncharacterized protein (TIGR01777 family)
MDLFLDLLIAQALMGAFDTIYHHELKAALPRCETAALELKIHSVRSTLYGVLFTGLAWFAFGGKWLWVLWALITAECVLTFADFLVEDRTRLLPKSERILHTLLAINGGGILLLLALQSGDWSAFPSALLAGDYGWKSWVLSLAAVGVTASGLRDALAARALEGISRHRPLDLGSPHLKLLVAGGTGFIGAGLVRGLLASGHEATVITRDPVRCALRFGGAVRGIASTDVLSDDERFDAIVNLSGAPVVGPLWTLARKRMLVESRLAAIEDLMKFARRASARARVWVQASAIGYYGQSATSISEEVPAEVSDFPSAMCHRIEETSAEADTLGIRRVTLRLGLVLGRTGGSLPPLLLALQCGFGAVIGSGRQFLSWIHIDDALETIAYAIREQEISGPLNAVAPETATYETFIRTAGEVTSRPVWLKVPERALRACLGEMATMIVDGPCVLPGKLGRTRHAFRYPTLRTALEDLA